MKQMVVDSVVVEQPGTEGAAVIAAVEDSSLELVFVHPLDPSLLCPLCHQALRSPLKLSCGHRFCQSCLHARKGGVCAVCMEGEGPAVLDKATHARIHALPVFCSFQHNQCPWMGTLRQLQDHLASCEMREMECPSGCGQMVQKRFLQQHSALECGKRQENCSHCGLAVDAAGAAVHAKVCPRTPINCPNQCGLENVPREELKAHLAECPLAGNACPFGEFGCDFAGGRQVLQKHIKEEPIRHLAFLCDGVAELKAMLAYMQLNTENMTRTISLLKQKSTNLEKMYGAQLVWRIDNMRQRQNEAKSGARAVIFSPPFFSSRHGYKMCLSACLYGDGTVRGQYLSVYASILRGDFDALLSWPFVHQITLSLLDQNSDHENRVNINYVMKPIPSRENKSFLNRPTSERNASFGAQRLCTLDTLSSYIQDDTIFIRCSVDTETMTTT